MKEKQICLFGTGRRGRPRSDNPLVFKTVGLTDAQWQWLSLWSKASPTAALRDLFDRASKFWPAGPARFR